MYNSVIIIALKQQDTKLLGQLYIVHQLDIAIEMVFPHLHQLGVTYWQ